MSHLLKRPQVAILGDFDGTDFIGNLWQRNGSNVSGVATADKTPHPDVIAFLNGYGTTSGLTLQSVVNTNKPAAFTSLTCGIDADNKFFLEGSHTFTHASSGTNPEASRDMFGYTGAETVQLVSGKYRLTAAGRWHRGVFQTDYDTVGGLKIATASGGFNNVSTAFTYSSAQATTHNFNDAVRMQPNAGSFTNGITTSDFLVNDTISATADSGATVTYKIVDIVTVGGNVFFDIVHGNGAPLNFAVDFSNNGFAANVTQFSATVLVAGQTVTDVVPVNWRTQSLVTWLRSRGNLSDADDKYSEHCLEKFEIDSGNGQLSWILEADGRVSFNYDSALSYGPITSNLNAAGQRLLTRLGFDGTEVETTTTANHRQVRGNNRALCVLATGRGYVKLRRTTYGRDDRAIMANGAVITSGLGTIKGWELTVRVEGPPHGYSASQELHLQNWWQYARRGLTIYPTFGDPDNPGKGGIETRRHKDKLDVYGTTTRHTLLQTIEADESASHFGKRVGGRLLVRRHPSDVQEREEFYDGALDMHQDISFKLLDDPSV